MTKWLNTFARFGKDKKYILLLSMVAACGYGFFVTHGTVGIDDTPYAYYFEEGLAAIVGRWVLFLLNKVIALADYAPFLTDFVAVILLMVAVTVWCGLFYRILGDKIPDYGYYVFAGVMLSCPLLSEILTYFLHNGIGIGYLTTGMSLCFFYELIEALEACKHLQAKARVSMAASFLGCVVTLVVALGCYESFMIVWLVGVLLVLFSERLVGKKRKMVLTILAIGAVAVVGMILRSVMIHVVTSAFGLGYMKDAAIQRSITEMAGWLLEDGAMAEFAMVLKRTFVMYGAFAYAYLPIRIFVIAAVMMLVVAIWKSIQSRDVWVGLLYIGIFVACFLLVVVEGKPTLYRSAQFVPVICGYGVLLLVLLGREVCQSNFLKGNGKIKDKARKCLNGVVVLVCGVILWNQCADMNKWFYIDYLKYEDAQNTMHQIAYELERNFDTSKPIVFTGEYELPQSIVQDAYVPYNSETYHRINCITSKLDEHLLEKFYRDYGVWVAQTPSLSVLNWAKYAFDNDEELIRFFAMHGYELVPQLDEEIYPIAEEYSLTLPSFPQEGSIVDMGEYIIVHF